MAYTFHVDPVHRLGVVQLYGRVTGEDVLEVSTLLFQHERWEPGFRELWDARFIQELVASLSDVRAVVRVEKDHAAHIGSGHVAIVIQRELVYQLARLFTTLVRDRARTYTIFRSMDEAQTWLDLPTLPRFVLDPPKM